MVSGCSLVVTLASSASQWAEMHRIAVGLGKDSPTLFHVSANRDFSIAFIGLPCPTNKTGIDFDISESPITLIGLKGRPKANPPIARLLMKFRRVSSIDFTPNSRETPDTP